MSEVNIKKKRGRKPKNFNTFLQKIENNVITEDKVNSEDEKIILHLPITLSDINNYESNNDSNNESTNDPNNDMSLFIKSEKDIKNNKLHLQKMKSSETSETIESIKSLTNSDSNKLVLNNNINKIITHNLNFNKNTKCWWCKNYFNSPAVQLPEDYYNNTFYCIGNFCGFSCMKSYNLDLNDSLSSKRESLINLLYYLTYSEYKEINPAPHWITLEEYGGNLSIEKFRENSVINNKEYLVLHPPLISRQMQIEESYKLNKLKEVPIDNINKIYSEIDSEYTIKRNTPIRNSQLNLETTMGLVKSKKKLNRL
jgi:hypothetical protein